MKSFRFEMVPAKARITQASAGQNAEAYGGGIGFAVVDGQLAIAIKGPGEAFTAVAVLHESVLDKFCGNLADCLAETSPEAARLLQERAPWPSLQ